MVLGKISAELMFDGHWSCLLGKNIYLNTSNTCSWEDHALYKKHLQRALQAPPPPNLNWLVQGSHNWLGLGGFALKSYYCVQILH